MLVLLFETFGPRMLLELKLQSWWRWCRSQGRRTHAGSLSLGASSSVCVHVGVSSFWCQLFLGLFSCTVPPAVRFTPVPRVSKY